MAVGLEPLVEPPATQKPPKGVGRCSLLLRASPTVRSIVRPIFVPRATRSGLERLSSFDAEIPMAGSALVFLDIVDALVIVLDNTGVEVVFTVAFISGSGSGIRAQVARM